MRRGGSQMVDALDVPWEDLATPEGAPTPEEKRREREASLRTLRRMAARGAWPSLLPSPAEIAAEECAAFLAWLGGEEDE